CLAAQTDKAFDVKFIRRNVKLFTILFGNSLGLEHDDFAALRFAKIVSEPVHEQMVAGAHLHFDDVFALLIDMIRVKTCAPLQRLLAEIRWKPKRLRLAAN